MALPSSLASPKEYSLVVFRGSLASLLRAGKATAPTDFVSEDVIYTATLDRSTYRLVSKSPLLHTHILLTVGERMSSKVATALAQEFAQTGLATKNSIVLKVAENQVKFWVGQAIQEQGPGLRAWKKTRLANGVQVVKCAFGLVTAGMGLASAVPTFGATSIPAVFAAWSALAETAGFVARAWQNVQEAELATLRQLRRVYEVYGQFKAGQKTSAAGVVPIAGASVSHRSRLGAHMRSAGDSVANALKLDTVTSVYGKSLGPSLTGFRSAIAAYEGKLAHLIAEANKLTAILMDLLDVTEQMTLTQSTDDGELLAKEDVINRMIGDEPGSLGVSRKRDLFRGPVSILWLQDYYKVGKDLASKMRHEVADLLQNTPLNQLDAQQRTADLLFTLGKWFGGNTDALGAGSFTAFTNQLFKEDNAISVAKTKEVVSTLQDWGKQAISISTALRRKYPEETESDLAKDCKTEYKTAASDVGGGMLDVYDTTRTNFASSLPDLKPAAFADTLLSKIAPGIIG